MRTTYGLPVCETCLDNLISCDENMMLFYIDLCATHYYQNKSISVGYSDDDYLLDDYVNELESMGLVKTIDDVNDPKALKVLPCMRQQMDKIWYCSEEKKHFG